MSDRESTAVPVGEDLSVTQIREREDGKFAVQRCAGARWTVLSAREHALWARVQECDGDIVDALQQSPDADFRDWLEVQRKLDASRRAPRLLLWHLPLPMVFLRVVLFVSVASVAYGISAAALHEKALFADVARLGTWFVAAWLACLASFSLAAVLRNALLVSAGLGPQPMRLGLRGVVPALVADPSAVQALTRYERVRMYLLEIFACGLPIGIFAAFGAWDAALFCAAAWFLTLYPVAEGSMAGLLGEILRYDDLATHARHYHKRLLTRAEADRGEAALAVTLSTVLAWVGGLLWLASFYADRWPPVTAYSLDEPGGLLNLFVTMLVGMCGLLAVLWLLGSMLRFVGEAVRPVLPTATRRVVPVREDDRDAIFGVLRQSPLLAPLGDEELRRLLDDVRLTRYRRGDLVERAADRPAHLQVLLTGQAAEVVVHSSGLETPARTLSQRDWFGEAALGLAACPSRNIRALTALTTAVLPVDRVRAVLRDACGTDEELDETVTSAAALSRNPLLQGASPQTIYALARALDREQFEAGAVVIREGDVGDRFYVVSEGGLEVTRAGSVMGRLDRGDFFGEMALLAGLARRATVIARTPCVLFSLSREAFWAILAVDPDLAAAIEAVAASRSRAS